MIALDTLLQNARIVDVFRLRVYAGWAGIRDDRFIYVEEGDPPVELKAGRVVDLQRAFLAPGLIDSHMHIESSLLTPRRFSEAALPYGTTTVLADAHEVANVAGEAGEAWMITAGSMVPLRVFHALPSCVPATAPEIETTAQVFEASEIARMVNLPGVIALGEVMDYRGLLGLSPRLPPMLAVARRAGLRLEGHIPTLEGMELSEYLSYGITSNHSLTFPKKMNEELSKGVALMLQAKSLTPENMAAVMTLADRSSILLVTDDIEPSLLLEGHLSQIVKQAVDNGLPPLEALASASLRPARYLGLRDLGGIAPGYKADFLVLDDLDTFPPRQVWIGGEQVAANGGMLSLDQIEAPPLPDFPALPGPFDAEDFRITTMEAGEVELTANVVRLDNQFNSLTSLEQVPLRAQGGYARFSEGDNLALVAVFARGGTSRCVGVIKDLGIRAGAAATSMAHDSHNLLVVGREPESMMLAANAVHAMGGGVVVASPHAVTASLELPVFSLLSDRPVGEVAAGLERVEQALHGLGITHRRAFLHLSFLALSVSPYYKFSDKGVVDTESRMLLPPVFLP
jgi:adenine deaminase